jgi:hypothetical protein
VDRVRRLLLLGVLGVACSKPPSVPVCGLHSASASVLLEAKKGDQELAVGAKLLSGDRIRAKGSALLECFTGSIKLLNNETVVVGELQEATMESLTLPRLQLKAGQTKPAPIAALPPSVQMRYSDNRFTPETVFEAKKENSSAEYFKAFFTPNGIENLAGGGSARPDGPSNLPPPINRPKISRIHAADLGQGGPTLKVTDDVIFAETDDLATAALVDGKTYDLGRAVRLVLPDGAEGRLEWQDGHRADLEGPMDLRLR